MTSYKDQYKANNGFGNIKNNRDFNKKICDIKRKEQRVEYFAINRELEETFDVTTNIDCKNNRHYKLLKWKAERDRRKKIEQLKRKPAFKVGVVHHNYYSPPVKDSITLPPTKQCLHGHKQIKRSTTPIKRITRATQKRLLQKSVVSSNVPQIQNISEKKKEILSGKETEKSSIKSKKSFAPTNYKFTAPRGLTNMPLFGRAAMLQTPVKALTSVNKENTAEVFLSETKSESPCTEIDTTKINVKDKTFDIDMTNESIEAITLKMSSDEHEMTFDNSPKEEKFLRNSRFSSNDHSPIISAPNISLTAAEKITKDQSYKEDEISSTRNIAEIKTENKTFEKINDKQSKATPPLRNVSVTLNDINSPKDPVFYSPYIVSSRGKSNARKEQQIRRGINCSPSENIPTKETVMKTLNISIEEEERTAQYFSFMLNKEIARLNELCKKWTEIQSELDITEDAQYQINQAIGQTHLLINKKFERFRGLVQDCETGKGEMLVTCRDLQGFWDMMYMEVMNCDSRFEALEKLRLNGWKEEEIVNKVVPNKKVKSKKKIVSKKKSSLQDFILAGKKKMKNKTENLETLKDHMNESVNKLSTSISNIDIKHNKSEMLRKNNIRESMSMNSKNRLSMSDKKTNSRQSLLQKTLLSESCKTVKTPMTIMKISQMCKTPKIELDDSISYINSKQTPSKSILKRTDDSTINETRCIKSVQKVNFDDHIISQEVPIDEEVQNKLDLAARLARIDNYDLDAEYANYDIRAEKKLNFNDDTFLDSESNLQCDTEQLNLLDVTKKTSDTPVNLEAKFVENVSSKSEDMSLKESSNNIIQNDANIKILRNRIVVTDNSRRVSTARRSDKGLVVEDKGNQRENKTPARKSSKLLNQKESITKKESLNATPVNLKKDLRRSLRKSVRFNAEDCGICTPHTRRSKGNLNLSYLQQDISPIKFSSSNKDLISWDSPKISTRRSARSSNKHFI